MRYSKKKVNNKYQLLVWLFLAEPTLCSWPKEIKLSKILLFKYPDLFFWKWVKLNFKLNSLAYFLSSKGKTLLYNKNKFYKKEKDVKLRRTKLYKLRKNKIGVDKKIPNKKLKLFDFIRHGKKKEN